MLSNILIALGFLGTGILVGLALAATAVIKNKGDNKKSETKEINGYVVTFVYDD